MTSDKLAEALRRAALFQELTSVQLKEIAGIAENVSFRTGDPIITAGSFGEAAFVIVSGSCDRNIGPALGSEAETIAAGSLIGEMAMLIETEFSSTVVCRGPVQALKISRVALQTLMAADTALAEHFVAKITGRLHAIADELRRFDRPLS